MAAIPVMLVGTVVYASDPNQTPIQCTIVAMMNYTDLSVGGGPIFPPTGPGGPPRPIHPIWGPPGFNPPGPGMPPGIGGGPIIPPDIPPVVPPDVTVPPPSWSSTRRAATTA